MNTGVQAETWTLQKWAQRQDNGGWTASCVNLLDPPARDPWSLVTLIASNFTAQSRQARGEPDIWKPALFLAVDPTGGPAREEATLYPTSFVCRYGEQEDQTSCDFSYKEYRFRYRLNDETRATDAWAGAQLSTFHDSDDKIIHRDSIAVTIWFDYPPEIFATDDETTIRLAFGGLTRGRGLDRFRKTRVRATFDHGAEALTDLEGCVEDHRKAGRLSLDNAPPTNFDDMGVLFGPLLGR